MLGDTVRARVKVIEARRSSRPGAGVAKFQFEVLKQVGAPVQRGVMTVLIKSRGDDDRRPEEPA